MKLLRFIALNSWVILLSLTTSAQISHTYLVQEADNYFKAGRYYDAFFRYRECAKLPEFEAESQISEQVKNSSHALYLTRKFKDFEALKQYQPAKEHLIELISLNASDPNKGELPHLTLAQGAELQRLAWRQRTPQATADMLKRAIAYYYQAAKEGLIDESIAATIRQCEVSIKETKVIDNEIVTQQNVSVLESAQKGSNATISPKTSTVASPRKTKPDVIIIPAPKEN